MADLEARTLETKRELAIEDGLDEIRTRNARIERNGNAMKEKLKVMKRLRTEPFVFIIPAPRPILGHFQCCHSRERKKDAPFAPGIKRI
jgi:hypothetical protein